MRVPQTEDQVKDCDQVNQINTEEKNIWSIGLGKSVEQLFEHQKNAADLIILRNWIENRKRSQGKRMAGASRALLKLWTDFRNLRIENDLIKRQKRIDEFNNLTQIVIQRSLLLFLHEHCGHFGMAKTFDRVRERFYWPGMKKDVHEGVSSCEECYQTKSPHRKHIHNLTTWKPSHQFWHVALDIMGPLPESSGNKFILLIEDQFTKWYEAIPTSNQEASTEAKAFVNVWISKIGCPANLHSDKGSNFMSNLFKNMCKELGFNRTSTTAYHPQGNAMIERTNRTIEESLAKYVGEHHNTWSDYLPLVMMAYRSSIHSVTKYSPFYLLYGRSCALPIDCMYQTIQTKIYPTLSDYVGCLKDELQTCHELVRESMDGEQERQKTYYDRSTFGPQYEVGDLVMVFNATIKNGQTRKLKSFYSGPQAIREIINDLNFVIEDVKTKKQQKVHYDRLKRFNSRKNNTDKKT